MAISIKARKSERILFCASKWWGDPDMPENMEYPTIQGEEEGETFDYPLTFVCQINCEDLIPFDPEGKLPHEGMLYFFAAMDEWLGYESPTHNGLGEWEKGHFVVKYAKAINFEPFQTCMLVGDEDEQLTEPELTITFSECEDSEECIKMLANVSDEKYPEHTGLLQIVTDIAGGIQMDGKSIDIIMKDSDLKFGNWKKAKAILG